MARLFKRRRTGKPEPSRLRRLLSKRSPVTRVRALRDLSRLPPEDALRPLCEALDDPLIAVRIEAAQALGRVGDARAVGPLVRALKRSSYGGAAVKQFLLGILLLPVFALWFLVGLAAAVFLGDFGGNVLGFAASLPENYYGSRRSRSPLFSAITDALVQIAERDPSPELRRALPELQTIASDVLQHERSARSAYHDAARKIAGLTEKLQSMPLPAGAPAADPAQLPLTGSAPRQDSAALPLVANSGAPPPVG